MGALSLIWIAIHFHAHGIFRMTYHGSCTQLWNRCMTTLCSFSSVSTVLHQAVQSGTSSHVDICESQSKGEDFYLGSITRSLVKILIQLKHTHKSIRFCYLNSTIKVPKELWWNSIWTDTSSASNMTEGKSKERACFATVNSMSGLSMVVVESWRSGKS